MLLTQDTTLPAPPLPLAWFKAHLHLGTRFTEAGLQDDLLDVFLRAAIAAVESRIGKALLERAFILDLPRWSDPAAQPLRIAPVTGITSLTLRDGQGTDIPVIPARWRLEHDSKRPRLRAAGGVLPAIPAGGSAVLRFTAGMAADGPAPDDQGRIPPRAASGRDG